MFIDTQSCQSCVFKQLTEFLNTCFETTLNIDFHCMSMSRSMTMTMIVFEKAYQGNQQSTGKKVHSNLYGIFDYCQHEICVNAILINMFVDKSTEMLLFCDLWLTLLTFRQVIANYLNIVTSVHANGQATNEPLFVNNLDWISCYYP